VSAYTWIDPERLPDFNTVMEDARKEKRRIGLARYVRIPPTQRTLVT
jgi:hypothetical protein